MYSNKALWFTSPKPLSADTPKPLKQLCRFDEKGESQEHQPSIFGGGASSRPTFSVKEVPAPVILTRSSAAEPHAPRFGAVAFGAWRYGSET